ncbi:response regulator transcription factor [Parasulfitobacter algicola]|uniref:Response regulator transcription factor n=1 Tax=Parasulfitobacter algicola TaxID=2614809 RepID=A0ABX2IR92_9RHOB|nr:response regulator transcription factor [Sulfitobacter algicola]NSX55409.1 response regulator transcription factor [Sulfitobacter algicola]
MKPSSSSIPRSSPQPLILIVEDDPEIADILSRYLERSNYRTVTAADGDMALMHAAKLKPDLLLLDLNLPARDGFAVLSALRVDGETPVIVVSAMDDDLDKLSALRIGADDYVTKPFNPNEVVARVAAVLRRGRSAEARTLRLGAITLDLDAHRAAGPNGTIELTPSEFSLLSHLMRHTGRVFSRDDLLDACLGHSEAMDRTVDSHLSNLRRKLADSEAEIWIRTVRGVGYRLDSV